jgi:hypothetical protein
MELQAHAPSGEHVRDTALQKTGLDSSFDFHFDPGMKLSAANRIANRRRISS